MRRRQLGSPKIRRAYEFLLKAEADDQVFTREDLSAASGWSTTTTKANLSKKLASIITKVNGGYKVVGVSYLTEDAFSRMCPQTALLASDPQRPRLDPKVEELVIKAREAALAGVQHYNNPTALFRSGNYIVLMIIAYTSLFHAVLLRDNVDYRVFERNGNLKTVDGEPMLWDVLKCALYYRDHYTNRYGGSFLTAVMKNIDFFLPIRHKIEHRFMPEVDIEIGGHCQSMLMNFEIILVKEFTSYYSMNMSLSLALQFSTGRSVNTIAALRRLQSAEYQDIRQYISNFHNTLPDEIVGDPSFAFRVWLVPKTANDARRGDLSIEFVPVNETTADQVAALEKAIVAFKTVTKEKFIDPARDCNMWESEVVQVLKSELGDTIQFGDVQKPVTGTMVRYIVKAHKIESPSSKYYRPEKLGSRAMYSRVFVDWIVEEYKRDNLFFYKAKLVAQEATIPSE